jgi:hypothetical protein
MATPDTPHRPLVRGLSAPRLPRAARRVAAFVGRNRVVVLFLLGLVVTDWGIGRYADLWDRHSPDDYAARVEGSRRRPQDLVFIGGSPVSEAIDPDLIAGITWGGRPLQNAYAVGLSGGTTSDFYHAVKLACPTPPRVLVYGITASDLNDSRHEPHGAYSLMGWADLVGWVRLRPDSAGWVTRHFAQGRLRAASNLYRYRHGIKMWAALEADAVAPGCCPDSTREANELRGYADALRSGNGYAPQRGFVNRSFAAVKAAGLAPKTFPYLDKYRTGSHLRYLHKLIEWCEERGVALVLVDMPMTADLEAMYPAAFAEYRSRLAELERSGAENGALYRVFAVVRSTREEIGLTDGHFADLIHLNAAGTQVFSHWLRGRLEGVGKAWGVRYIFTSF